MSTSRWHRMRPRGGRLEAGPGGRSGGGRGPGGGNDRGFGLGDTRSSASSSRR